MDFTKRSLVGLALLLVGVAAFVPPLLPTTGVSSTILVAAAVLLTVGTYLLGTDVEGRPV